MEDDLNALKKGQSPAGVGVQKQPEPTQISSAPLPPKPVLPKKEEPSQGANLVFPPKVVIPSPSVNIPKIPMPPKPRASGGMFSSPTSSRPNPPPLSPLPKSGSDPFAKAQISIPPPLRPKLSPTVLIISLAVLGIVGFSVWFVIFHQPAAPDVGNNPTSIASSTPVSTPLPAIETVFSKVDSVTMPLSDSFFKDLELKTNVQGLANREVGLYKILNSTTSERYSLSQLSDGISMKMPLEIISAVDNSTPYVAMMNKSNGKISYGLIAKVTTTPNVTNALSVWESVMATNLNKLFGLGVISPSASSFQDNKVSYPGVNIRYLNFPDPELTIDYTVVPAPNGENYLVITNSREQMFAIIERIKTISP